MARIWKSKIYAITIILIFSVLYEISAWAAGPQITIVKGNPTSEVSPPYTFVFSVSDPTGIISLKLNGRDLGADGADFYDGESSVHKNGSYEIVATNTAGEQSSKTIVIDKIVYAVPVPESTEKTTTAAVTEAQTFQETVPPETNDAKTVTKPTEATQIPTVPPTVISTEPADPVGDKKNNQESEGQVSTEGELISQEETVAEDKNEMVDSGSTNNTEIDVEETKNEVDTFKLYPGGKNRNTGLVAFKIILFIFMFYNILTLILNIIRNKRYKKLKKVLEDRKLKKEKNS